MRLSKLNKISILTVSFLSLFFLDLKAEQQIDLWKKDNINTQSANDEKKNIKKENENIKLNTNIKTVEKVEIENNLSQETLDVKIYGIHDPEKNNFKLSLWENSESKEIKNAISRINKLNLSKIAEEIFQETLLTYSYTPTDMSKEEFLEIKINWMIKNEKDSELKIFLEKNQDFHFQTKAIKYLVDKSISNADIKKACEDINFLSKDIKDSYLEKFKIYCYVFNKKNDKALLLYDILREEKQSDKFFDDKIQYLLGIKEKTIQKINDKNLLNFYLSSVTIDDFKYVPTKNTPKFIWDYMDSADLIDFNVFDDLIKIKELELAANEKRLNTKKIFSLYKKIPFELEQLINASEIYDTLDTSEARAVIYQKILLSDNTESKIKLLFILKDLFEKDKLSNIYPVFLSDSLKNLKDVPKEYAEVVEKNIALDSSQKN